MKINKFNYLSAVKKYLSLLAVVLLTGLCVSCARDYPGNYYNCNYPYAQCTYSTSYYYGYKYYYPYQYTNTYYKGCNPYCSNYQSYTYYPRY